jgi:pimeloyl-ACP methyl ester carboxylesterase
MSGPHKPRVVVTIHGIRTHGQWQKRITPHLAKHGLIPYHIDYGFFRAVFFFFKPTREKQVSAVRNELRNLVSQVGAGRISVIAHSFGTLIAMESLVRDNGNFKYDRVVLTGSIVPLEFDWKAAIEKGWVMAVRNERATKDWVVKLADWVSHTRVVRFLAGGLSAGRSGVVPFSQQLPQVLDDYVAGHHSETHNPLKFEQWARFVAYPHLPNDLLERITTEMETLRQQAGSILGLAPELVRANLFAPLGGALRIVPGAHSNMTYAPEFDLKIEVGHGATGAAFDTGNPCLVVKKGNSWTGNHLPGTELDKINPALRWVISLPVRSETRSTIVGVVNVDGLDNVPAMLEDVKSEDCQAALLALHLGMLQRFRPCLEAAFRGVELEQVAR